MVTLKCSYTVKPAEPTPIIRQWLPEADQLQALTHAPTVYFYPSSKPDSIDSPLETLKDSLSQALVYFYPLAGRLHVIDGGRLELDCNAMGAEVFEAYSESTIKDFGDFAPTPELRKLLVPPIDYNNTPFHELPLVLVQLTKFKCGGLSIGLAISHSMVDGQAALHFISCWAKIARGEKLVDSDQPFLDRTILKMDDDNNKKGPRYHHVEFDPPPLMIGASDDKEERSKETTVTMLKLTKEQVEKLKQKANIDRTKDDMKVRMYSRYESLAGHIWRCTCKARGHDDEQLTGLRISVDCRHRLRPPLPPKYFGNVTFKSTPVAKSGDLMKKPLSYAASKMREGAEMFNDDYIRSSVEYLKNESDWSRIRRGFHSVGCPQGDYLGNPNLAVTSWIGLSIYDADFGWGKPIYMGPATLGFDGKSFVIPGDGDGSLLIALRLRVDHMEAFKEFFYQDI
ncbi:Transferase [Macleaya cordata]|uniref:Transferase n=1 Tax=Macleaya cordata TaxID=56857 RepID=A0A200Q3Q9_MACCD|nr:Transferase [Macleaya cordata]